MRTHSKNYNEKCQKALIQKITEKGILLILIINVFFSIPSLLNAQKPNFTANTFMPEYKSPFLYGVNAGWYGDNWNDIEVAKLAAAAGAGTYRLGLNENAIEQYGVHIREKEFAYYYNPLKLIDNAVFLNQPSDNHTDYTIYTNPGIHLNKPEHSLVFKNLYKPIWLPNGEVNPENYYAVYIDKMVKVYGKNMKFWEVWNEPDFFLGKSGFKQKGEFGNWYENAPDPQELTALRAPIYFYIRMMRITYEVVKKTFPDSYITTGGLGFPGFLAACLNYSDNPDNGKITPEYPFKGGAYFDVLCFHDYPLYAVQYYDNKTSSMKYRRNSDTCVELYRQCLQSFQDVLKEHGYGSIYPAKPIICTETNISENPQNPNPGLIGSPQEQRNYIMKMFTISQKLDIKQVYVFVISDGVEEEKGVFNVANYMGLYKPIKYIHPGEAQLTDAGIAFKTMATLLKGYRYDSNRTKGLELSKDMDGAAFRKGNEYRYILWARTHTDLSEIAACHYTLPSFLRGKKKVYYWNSSSNGFEYHYEFKNRIILTGDPIIVKQ